MLWSKNIVVFILSDLFLDKLGFNLNEYFKFVSSLPCIWQVMIKSIDTILFCGFVKNEAKYTLCTDFILTSTRFPDLKHHNIPNQKDV